MTKHKFLPQPSLGVLPWPGIPPPVSPPNLVSKEITPYVPPVLLSQRPLSSPLEILYHVLSPYDVKGKRHPLSHHTPCNIPWFSSFSRKVGPSPVARHFYTSAPYCPHMNPSVHIIALVLFRFVCKPTLQFTLCVCVCHRLRLGTPPT